MTLSPEEIARLRALEAAATPGPWTREKPSVDEDGWLTGVAVAGTPGRQTIYASPPGGTFPSADCDLLVAARNALRALLDEIERLGAKLAELREAAACAVKSWNTAGNTPSAMRALEQALGEVKS